MTELDDEICRWFFENVAVIRADVWEDFMQLYHEWQMQMCGVSD